MVAESRGTRPAITQWRNWPLPVKLGAVVLVPVIFAVTLSVSQISSRVAQADQYRRVEQVLDAVERVEPLLASVQQERTQAVRYLVHDAGRGPFAQQMTAVDEAAEGAGQIITARAGEYSPVVQNRYDDLRTALGRLSVVRQQVDSFRLPPDAAIHAYGDVVTATLNLYRALTSTVADPGLSGNATAMLGLLDVVEEVRLQQAWALTGLTTGSLSRQAIDELQGSRSHLQNKIDDARAVVGQDWQQRLNSALSTPEVATRDRQLTAIIAEATDNIYTGGFSVRSAQWNESNDQVAELITHTHEDLHTLVHSNAFALQDQASDAAGWDSVVLLSTLIAAAWIIIVIARQLLGSLRQLRLSARDVAEYELPEVVGRIRAGQEPDPEAVRVPVETTDEIGQLARAFGDVNQQALRLAAEQASQRRGYNDIFVSVSRRSQALLERQLRLFEDLEHDEEDPDQLSRLFQLDHLATRMRRNNENLMVLAGTDLTRRFNQPTELADVLRAAVSEIEQYPRVAVQPPPSLALVGPVASDMVRLVAELLDNAANFSAPDTSVTMSSYQAGDGTVIIDVLDEGIGMGYAELTEANACLSTVDDDDVARSRRLGLLVAGRLAVRHGIQVQLHGGPDVEGVRATVAVPAEYVVKTGSSGEHLPPPGEGVHRNGVAHHDMPTSGSFGVPAEVRTHAESAAVTHEFPQADFDSYPPQDAPQPADLFTPSSSRQTRAENPTMNLFAPTLDTPQQHAVQPEPEYPEYGWEYGYEWPSDPGTGSLPPAEPEQQAAPIYEEVSTQWFQPAGVNAQYQPMAQPGYEYEWPAAEESLPPQAEPKPAQAPEPESEPAPAPEPNFTPAGLPRRTPRGGSGFTQDQLSEQSGQYAPTAADISQRIAERHHGVRFGQSESSTASSSGEDAWNFAADEARRAAEAATTVQPATFTPAGLPRRTPKAQLAPGSVSSQEADSADSSFDRDPDQLRGRLADFQSGLDRGRHWADER